MRPIHPTPPTSSAMPSGDASNAALLIGANGGVAPYNPAHLNNHGRGARGHSVSVLGSAELASGAAPAFFAPPQQHVANTAMHPGTNNAHRNKPDTAGMFFHAQGPPQYLPPSGGNVNSFGMPPPAPRIAPPGIQPLYGAGLFPYISNCPPPMNVIPEMRAPVPSQNAPVHPPAAQRGPTVYLGHLTPDTDDVIIRQLLQECGRVLRWSRTTDPATKKLSSFGFCEFESPLGVTRAVRCLHGLVLDGQSLVANCEDKVKEGLEQWRNDRKNKLQEENPAKSIQEIEHEIEKEELRIAATTQRIAAEWNAKLACQRVNEGTLNSEPAPPYGGGVAPPAPAVPPSNAKQTSAPTEPFSRSRSTTATVAASAKHENVSTSSSIPKKQQLLDALPGYVEVPAEATLSSREASRVRQWNNAIKDARAEFRRRCQAWERKEDYFRRERKRVREETEKLLENPSRLSSSQRKRLIDKDLHDLLYFVAPDRTIWEGPLSSRRAEERAAWLEKERERDKQDRLDEVEEQCRAEKQKTLSDAQLEEKKTLESPSVASTDVTAPAEEAHLGSNGGRGNLDIIDKKATASTPIHFNLSLGAREVEDEKNVTTQKPAGASQMSINQHVIRFEKTDQPSTTRHSRMSSVFSFGDDEDDDDEFRSRRKLLSSLPTTHTERPTSSSASTVHQSQDMVMRIAAQIPKTTEELFAFPIDWALLKANKTFETKVTPWIGKKVVEFLGEEEPELTIFISTKVGLEPNPEAFLDELKEFLDEDAKGFTVKLWKMLVFEVLRLRQQTASSTTR